MLANFTKPMYKRLGSTGEETGGLKGGDQEGRETDAGADAVESLGTRLSWARIGGADAKSPTTPASPTKPKPKSKARILHLDPPLAIKRDDGNGTGRGRGRGGRDQGFLDRPARRLLFSVTGCKDGNLPRLPRDPLLLPVGSLSIRPCRLRRREEEGAEGRRTSARGRVRFGA
ncbi:hypothetical protein BDY24DRAFT_442603 [Mrakia frigida]|uniref:uncharacterized protein n=1 Tax=Mrakia frigida TaxID=29902 RepID=UPI003FCC040A